MSGNNQKSRENRGFRAAKLASAVGLAAMAAMLAGVFAPAARAEYIQTLGISERTASLGNAVTAISDDFDAFATNPAGAASFRRPTFGIGARVLSTENLHHEDGIWGGNDLDRTIQHANQGVLPGLGLYVPVGSAVTVGLGVSAPFALAGVLNEERGIARYSSQDIELLTLELAPTMAIRATSWLDVGATFNWVAFKHLKENAKLGDGLGNLLLSSSPAQLLSALANGDAAGGDPLHKDDGVLGILTDNSFGIGLPPHQVEPSFDEFSYTLGAKAKLTDRLTLGVTYREETNMSFGGGVYIPIDLNGDGDIADTIAANVDAATLGAVLAAVPGLAPLAPLLVATCINTTDGAGTDDAVELLATGCSTEFKETAIRNKWKANIDMPRHVQAGMAYELVPNFLRLSADVKWTNWASVDGFGGQQLDVKLEPGIDVPLCDLLNFAAASLGDPIATGPVSAENCVSNVRNEYSANNTFSYFAGAEIMANQHFSIQAGYGFEKSPFEKSKQDTITFSSDRHLAGLGLKFENIDPKTKRGFKANIGGQMVFYDRGFDPRQSENMGGLSFSPFGGPLGAGLGAPGSGFGLGLNPVIAASGTDPGKLGVGFGPNQANSPFGPNQSDTNQNFNGYIWAAGAGASFIF